MCHQWIEEKKKTIPDVAVWEEREFRDAALSAEGVFPKIFIKKYMILNSSEKALGHNKSNLPPFSTHLSSKLKRLKANTKKSLIISQSEKLSF